MKKNLFFKTTLFLACLTFLVACGDDEGEDPTPPVEEEKFTVYMAGAGKQEVETGVDATPLELMVSVATVETAKPSAPIQVSIAANEALVSTFNTDNGTNYEVLPADSYTMESNGTIASGENEVEFVITVEDNVLQGLKTYLLPIVIEKAEGAEVKTDDITNYFVITTNYVELVRTDWTVEASSEEPTEAEYDHGGFGWALADGNDQTFWHTKWNGGNDEPPYYVIVDMKEAHSIHGFSFLGRQDNTGEQWGRFKAILLEVSSDGTNFTEAGTIEGIQNTEAEQTFYLSEAAPEARYFKLTVSDWYGKDDGAKYVHLAELRVY